MWAGDDLDRVAVGIDIVRAGVDRLERDVVRVAAVAHYGDHAAWLELPRDRAGAGERAAVLGEHGAHVGRGAVLVVRRGLDQDGHATWTVALVHDLLELLGG